MLLAGFPLLLVLITWAFTLLAAADSAPSFTQGLRDSIAMLPQALPVAIVIAAVWFGIAWLANQRIIDAVAGARPVTRAEEPLLWNTLEALAISRGMRMPRLAVIETEARNAYASGLSLDKGAVTVTRGLLQALNPAELRAVLAHELTHIRNGDARLAVVAAVFAGVISLGGEMIWRSMRWRSLGMGRRTRSASNDRGKGGAAMLVLVALAVAALAWALSIALRMALSRNREYLADAGAVELTADPDAMVSALRRIEGHAAMPKLPSQMQAMLLDDGISRAQAAWFATHPPIDARIKVLVETAGARDMPKLLPAETPPEAAAPADDDATRAPWITPPAGGDPAAPAAGAPHSPASSPPASPWWRQPRAPHGPG